MLNRVSVQGRLVRDIEVKVLGDGTHVAKFSIACERDYASKVDGKREVDFFDLLAWKGTADFAEKYFKKGDMMVAGGRMQTRSYEDASGNTKRTIEIVVDDLYFCGGKKKEEVEVTDEMPFA